MIPYTPPSFGATAFNCPHCNAYSNQIWQSVYYLPQPNYSIEEFSKFMRAQCTHCNQYTLWHFQKMIFPEDSGVRPPNLDLKDDIKEDYLEAKDIVNKSPRGATALLRLCIQKICEQLGESGKNINNDIANLVEKGLPQRIQQALDIVRVIGNNAVHPGKIDLKDDRDTAMRLFELINLVTEVMITQPKEIEKLYGTLPQTQIDAIQQRDKGGATSSNNSTKG
jgi:hypothetical protein